MLIGLSRIAGIDARLLFRCNEPRDPLDPLDPLFFLSKQYKEAGTDALVVVLDTIFTPDATKLRLRARVPRADNSPSDDIDVKDSSRTE